MPNAAPMRLFGEWDSRACQRLGNLKTVDGSVRCGKSTLVKVIGLKGITPFVLLAQAKDRLVSKAASGPFCRLCILARLPSTACAVRVRAA